MSKVFILTEGEYSDYHIIAAFTTKVLAEQAKKIWDDAGQGEQVDIEEHLLDELPPYVGVVFIYMNKHLQVISASRAVLSTPVRGFSGFRAPLSGGPLCLVWLVETNDEQRAVKVAAEKAAQILAMDLWGDEAKVGQLFP